MFGTFFSAALANYSCSCSPQASADDTTPSGSSSGEGPRRSLDEDRSYMYRRFHPRDRLLIWGMYQALDEEAVLSELGSAMSVALESVLQLH